MGTGNYALGLNFKGATPPSRGVAHRGRARRQSRALPAAAQADGSNGNGPYVDATPVDHRDHPDNGVSSQDGITNSRHIAILGSAAYQRYHHRLLRRQ